jgi:hypothetical protein
MLKAHCHAANHTLTASQLSSGIGLSHFGEANLLFGKFAHRIADQLGYAPGRRADGSTRWWSTLAYGRDAASENGDEHFEWIMRPELVAALRQMRWA